LRSARVEQKPVNPWDHFGAGATFRQGEILRGTSRRRWTVFPAIRGTNDIDQRLACQQADALRVNCYAEGVGAQAASSGRRLPVRWMPRALNSDTFARATGRAGAVVGVGFTSTMSCRTSAHFSSAARFSLSYR